MADMNEKDSAKESAASPKAPEKKADKPNIFQRMGNGLGRFFRNYKSEMNKVVWLSGKETSKSSFMVTVTVVVSAVAIGLVDALFTFAINALGAII